MRRIALALTVLLCACPRAARADDQAAPDEGAAASPGYKPPHVVPYEGGSIPRNAHIEGRANMKLLGPGLVVAAIPYGFSLLYALSTCGAQMECRAGSAWLYAPVIGPFITAYYAPTSGGAALSIFDGALQTVGAAIFLAGLTMPKQVVVWQDDDVAVRVAPAPVAGGVGVVLSVMHL